MLLIRLLCFFVSIRIIVDQQQHDQLGSECRCQLKHRI